MNKAALFEHCKPMSIDSETFSDILESLDKSAYDDAEHDSDTVDIVKKACHCFENEISPETSYYRKLGIIRERYIDSEDDEDGIYIPIPF